MSPSPDPVARRESTGRLDALPTVLCEGELHVDGRLIQASNATLFGRLSLGEECVACVYKPRVGERPLWDFPDGTLALREYAAYCVSQATGWDLVPPTVLRDGPFGPGMVQLWVDVDPEVDLGELSRSEHPDVRRIAVFDAVINNADRKGSHLLPTPDGRVHAVDHGVCFSVHDKLRTLLWQWRGRPLPKEALAVLRELRAALAGELGATLGALLAPAEVEATRRRVARLLRTGRFPEPSRDWPSRPWPPF